MGIYIKGMEMPPACNRCWNCDINTVDGTETEPPYACLIRMKFVEEEWEHKRPKWCPLVEVPKFVGGLIGRNVLLKNAADNEYLNAGNGHEEEYLFWQKVFKWVADAPTIIEEERETE